MTGTVLSDDEIHQRIVDAIVDQRLLPGTKLVEDKLGQVFGVSRTRIRQVLIRLAQEQVVVLQPNKGASVARPTVTEAREVFEARTLVEAVLVRRFAAGATTADLQALAQCVKSEETARRQGDAATALRQSGRFHLLLAEAAGHQTFSRFLHKLVSRTSLILMSHGPADVQPTTSRAARWVQVCRCEEHRGLLAALRTARRSRKPVDVERAVALMTRHLAQIEAGLEWSTPEARPSDWMSQLSDMA
ncbi:GntR family transcriptional regulator [Piscinibacter terrae]|uniref:GntR family transcriptional regulator n=1 Tax=Piscinibacter terrae TaxID=2496871 RepID=A0A3N7JV36_9BURK|nr:GntR family transcriptional regulator [Albitalea terrae]RQP22775.1 GntR family transcriptional regulator [Albitalea terrae]